MSPYETVKRFVIGRALRTEQAAHERLTKKVALAIFSSDALSSTAYATEEILLVLAVAVIFQQQIGAQADAFNYVIPISIGIATLLGIVTLSYRQTIHAYPGGGGAYIVAKENLGELPGLVAGSALLVDYVLTVSVSIAAGVAAITSAVQGTSYAWLNEYKVTLCLIFIVLIAMINLRGVRESGVLFALPTYAFLFSFLFMIGYGLVYYQVMGGIVPLPGENLKTAEGYEAQALTLFLLLGAFSNGCSALTGVEAISTGVQSFKKPEAKNASQTLIAMSLLLGTMFVGISALAYLYEVHPHTGETVISQFARHIFTGPMSWFYYVVQTATAMILILAANTAFNAFPSLSSLLARDRFLPRQFAIRGDRLVFSNGIAVLAFFSAILVIAFEGDTSRLIPLYAVGVFLSFTLSQTGMVKHWLDERRKQRGEADTAIHRTANQELEGIRGDAPTDALPDAQLATSDQSRMVEDAVSTGRNWRGALVINSLGAFATFVVLCVFIATKFVHGAWIVVVVIPILVLTFKTIHSHYVAVARQLSLEGLEQIREIKHTVIVPISGVHRGVINALQYAKSIAPDNVIAVYVDIDEEATAKLREKWETWGGGIKLKVIPSPYRELTRPLLRYINRVERLHDDDVVTVILPEFVPAKYWQQLLHNQSSLLLKGALLFKPGIIVTSVPYHLRD